jgi:hypothetical protein
MDYLLPVLPASIILSGHEYQYFKAKIDFRPFGLNTILAMFLEQNKKKLAVGNNDIKIKAFLC